MRSCSLPYHSAQETGEHPPRAAIDAAHVLEVASPTQVLLHEAYVALIIKLVPGNDCFGREVTVPLLLHPTTVTERCSG